MPIQFRCSQCHQVLSIATRKAGSRISCPVCQGALTVPAGSETMPPRRTEKSETAIHTQPAANKNEVWWLGEERGSNGQGEAPASQPQAPETMWTQIAETPKAENIEPTEAPAATSKPALAPEPIPPTGRRLHLSRRQAILAGSGAAASVLIAVAIAWIAWPGNPGDNPEADKTIATVENSAVNHVPQPPAVEEKAVELPELVAAPTPSEEQLTPRVLLPEPPQPKEPAVKEPAPRKRLVVKRRDLLSEEDLRKQMEKVPELALDRGSSQQEAFALVAHGKTAHRQRRTVDTTPLLLKQHRPDLAGLPMRMGDACKIGPSTAEHLEGGSLKLRAYLFDAVQAAAAKLAAPGAPAGVSVRTTGVDPRPDPTTFNQRLAGDGDKYSQWLKPEAIPALLQLLMAENQSVRRILVEQLGRIEGHQATVALAQRALFDLNPEIREMAIEALRDRSRRDYLPTLLEGFRYPWAPVADHAAEALVALDCRDAVPKVLSMLDQPAPGLAYSKDGKAGGYVHEVVRINHMRNCVMCHAPSFSQNDKVRGFVPDPTKPVPPSFTRAYYTPTQQGIFVRADVTYLQQDFSVPQPVPNHGQWPSSQRYDYMVRERPAQLNEVARAREAAAKGPSEQQKSMFFALRELTGADPGPSAEDWKRLFLQRDRTQKLHGNLRPAQGMAVDMVGNVYYSDAGENVIYKVDGAGKVARFLETSANCSSIMFDPTGRLIACQPAKARIVAIDLASKAVTVLADRYQGKAFTSPDGLVVDRHGGVYFTDLNIAALKTPVYYLSAQGTLTRILASVPWARGMRLAPDEKTLYLLSYATPEVWAYPLEGAGLVGKGKVLGKLQQKPSLPAKGGTSMAADMDGNLYLTHPTQNAIQVMTAEGATLALVPLPDAPMQCCFGGTDLKTLYVRTFHGLYGIKVDTAGHRLTAKQR